LQRSIYNTFLGGKVVDINVVIAVK